MTSPGAWILVSVAMLIGGSVLLICVIELARNSISRRAYQQGQSGEVTRTGKRRLA